ncbi:MULTISPECIES: ABC transporter permease [Actinoalloteichus]|uniref:Carbohydrate ABC transporter membrane protein 1, CUT1 family n=1 Tax=Actinoalloteichus caeruleus DSM 43889 TaxID=1120930 RepID=A0ABT1JCY2_ACTCY|nr:ABC transporter permease subunit [Actinoalloteichus caeruleus]MCP2330351.1 carbohydrate ABC transporter membrane protein 1, CUT1 family [Actinoalloteichus caeruleus DSM 43889]
MDSDTTATRSSASPRERRRADRRRRLRRDWPLLLMTAPAILVLGAFHYLPLLGNVIAFQDYSPFVGILNSPFVGFDNFQRLFGDPAFWNATLNTLYITAFQLVFYFPVPILLALLVNSLLSARIRLFIQSVVYLPHFFSWVLVITLFQQMLGGAGALNTFLRQQGLTPFDVMTNPDTFVLLVTAEGIWKDAGWGMIIFLAALSTVNQNLYEAAAVDGAGRWRRMWHVTLPALVPVIVLLLIMRLGDALSVGFEQFLLQRGAVGADASEVLDTYVYYEGVVNGDFAYAGAAGLFKGVVGLLLVLGANKVAHLLGEEGVYSRR